MEQLESKGGNLMLRLLSQGKSGHKFSNRVHIIVKVLQERKEMALRIGRENVVENMNDKGTQVVMGLKKVRCSERATQTPVTYTQEKAQLNVDA